MNIKQNRKQMSMTQLDLAKELNIAESTISKGENGTMEPAIGEIKKMAALFEITIDELIEGKVKHNKVKELKKTEKEFYRVDMGGDASNYTGHGKLESKSRVEGGYPSVVKKGGMYFDLANIFGMIFFSIPYIAFIPVMYIYRDSILSANPELDPNSSGIFVLISLCGLSGYIVTMIGLPLGVAVFGMNYLPTGIDDFYCDKGRLEGILLPLLIFFKIFKVDSERKGGLRKGVVGHKDTFLAYEKYFDVKSYDGEYIRVNGKDVLDIHLPVLNKTRSFNTPHKTVSKIKSDKLFGETYTQTNKTMVSHTEKYQEYGNIEITIKDGKKYTINSTKDRDFSLLTSVGRRQ